MRSIFRPGNLDEMPCADSHAGCCGGWGIKAPGYPILCRFIFAQPNFGFLMMEWNIKSPGPRIVGIDYKYLQKVESQSTPDLKIDTIQKIAKALKTTPSKLLDI